MPDRFHAALGPAQEYRGPKHPHRVAGWAGPAETSSVEGNVSTEILYILRKIFSFPTFQCLRFVQIILFVGSPQPYFLSSSAPFITVRCRRPPSSLRRRLARRVVASAAPACAPHAVAAARCCCCRPVLRAAGCRRCCMWLLRCWLPPPLLRVAAAAACGCALLGAATARCYYAAPAHTAARKKLPFNISILIFSTFYVSNFNILFSQFQHFESQMLNIFNKMLS